METGPSVAEAISKSSQGGVSTRLDAKLRSLALLERSKAARRLVDLSIRGIRVEPIPPWLDESRRAILVCNYPSVSQTLRAVIKVACRLPGDEFRLRGIGRPEVITQATALQKALGVPNLVFPVHKDQAGAYRLQREVIKDVVSFLDGPGHVLWMSITGRTRGNGLLEADLRTGAALFAINRGVPLVPMAVATKEKKGRLRVVKVRFGEPIDPPDASKMGEFERADFLVDFSRLALCHVARLLPRGQRGDFEDIDEKLVDTERRWGISLTS
jgi:1-acyl-sn-glycerol-3-phosphate acyltransferase